MQKDVQISETTTPTKTTIPKEKVEEDEDVFEAGLFIDTNYVLNDLVLGDTTLSVLALNTASTDFDMTGQVIWGGCKLLGTYLVNHPEIVKGKNVLEVGAGTGVCGLIAGVVGSANRVVLTDYQATVLELLRDNVALHPSPPAAPMQVANLTWGEDLDKWTSANGRFEVLLGADVIYWPTAVVPLLDTVIAVMEKSATAVFYMSYRDRSGNTTALLMKMAEARGLVITEVPTEDECYTALKLEEDDVRRPYYIFAITWSKSEL